jgi:hypothetical protein
MSGRAPLTAWHFMHPPATSAFFPAECGPDSVSNTGGAEPWFGPPGGFDELVELDTLQPKPSAAITNDADKNKIRFIMNRTLLK